MGTRLAVAAVALLLLASCDAVCGAVPASTTAQPRIACVDTGAPHHAYVVVQHASGVWLEQCVGFTSQFITGQALMGRTSIRYETQASSVCRIDGEPASCQLQSAMRWALFLESGGRWSPADGGFTTLHLTDTQTMGWRYVSAGDAAPSPPPLPHKL